MWKLVATDYLGKVLFIKRAQKAKIVQLFNTLAGMNPLELEAKLKLQSMAEAYRKHYPETLDLPGCCVVNKVYLINRKMETVKAISYYHTRKDELGEVIE
jgi:hypothetical protein